MLYIASLTMWTRSHSPTPVGNIDVGLPLRRCQHYAQAAGWQGPNAESLEVSQGGFGVKADQVIDE